MTKVGYARVILNATCVYWKASCLTVEHANYKSQTKLLSHFIVVNRRLSQSFNYECLQIWRTTFQRRGAKKNFESWRYISTAFIKNVYSLVFASPFFFFYSEIDTRK